MKKTILLIVFSLLFIFIRAQEGTKKTGKAEMRMKYEQASKAYQVGDMDKSIEILEEIIYSNRLMKAANKQQRAEVMRLAAMTALYKKRTDLADKYIKKILMYQPSYKIDNVNTNDLIAIKAKLEKLYAVPKLSVGVGVGTNTTFIERTDEQTLMNHDAGEDSKYKNTIGAISLFATFEYALMPVLSFSGKLSYTNNKYKYLLPIISDDRKDTAFQTLNYIQLPLTARFGVFSSRKISPYIQGGATFKYLSSSERLVNDTKSPMNEYYKTFDIGLLAGGGVKLYLSKFAILNIEVLYYHGFNEINNSENRFLSGPAGDEFLFQYYDVMDNIKLRNMSLSLSLSYAINHKVFRKQWWN